MNSSRVASASSVVDVTLEPGKGSASQQCSIAFSREQPGLSALVGVWREDSRSFVVKVAKTPAVRWWTQTVLGTREPTTTRAIRRVAGRWNALAPSPTVWPVFERFNELCQRWLVSPAPEALATAVRDIPGAEPAAAAALIDELRELRSGPRFGPRISEAARATFPHGGPAQVFTLIQENVGSPTAPAHPVIVPVGLRLSMAGQRLAHLELLVLLAYAALLAQESGLGLDLAPRVTRGQLCLPNVLAAVEDGRPVYVDYFGLAQRNGNLAESAAFGALYGRHGLIRALCRSMYRRLVGRANPLS